MVSECKYLGGAKVLPTDLKWLETAMIVVYVLLCPVFWLSEALRNSISILASIVKAPADGFDLS